MRTFAEHRVANRIRHLADGQAALDYLFNRGLYADPVENPRPHVILLDLRLPRVDGLAVLRQLSPDGRKPPVPVLVLSGDVTPERLDGARGAGATEFLSKPVDVRRLFQVIGRLIQAPNSVPSPTP